MKRVMWCLGACVNASGFTLGALRHDVFGIIVGVFGMAACIFMAVE